MKIIQSTRPTKVALVGCLHGNELIGKRLFDYYQTRISALPGLIVILANEEAMEEGTRGIDGDLNRSFTGSSPGNHEERLARELLSLVQDAMYVLDLHTTSALVDMVPIIANLDESIRRVINQTHRENIVLMQHNIAARSLIGNVRAGVSLEFNEVYAETADALKESTLIVQNLLDGVVKPKFERHIFNVDGTIPLDANITDGVKDFVFSEDLNGYPFLLREREYTTHQGFLAKSFITKDI